MEKDHLLEQLDLNLSMLKLTIQRMRSDSALIKQIDIDLLRYKTVQFYDQINQFEIIFNEKKTEAVFSKSEMNKTYDFEMPVIQEIKSPQTIVSPKASEEKAVVFEPENIKVVKPEINEIEALPEIVKMPEPKISTVEKPIEDSKTENSKTGKITLHEKFAKQEKSINEQIQANKQDKGSLADKMQKGKITDLKGAISLNQKIAFVKELFNGDEKEYKKFIEFINKCDNYSEAKYFIQDETGKREHWKQKHTQIDCLMEYVNRKFL